MAIFVPGHIRKPEYTQLNGQELVSQDSQEVKSFICHEYDQIRSGQIREFIVNHNYAYPIDSRFGRTLALTVSARS